MVGTYERMKHHEPASNGRLCEGYVPGGEWLCFRLPRLEPPRDSWRPVGVSQADVADSAS